MNFVHNYYKPICLSLLILLGLSSGHLVDSILQMKLRPPGVEATIAEPLAPMGASKPSEEDLNLILQNNLFDAKNRSASAAMHLVTDHAATGQAEKATQRVDLKLIGTVVADGKSLALIEAKGELKIYALGEEVPGGGTVEEIDRIRVAIRNSDQSLSTLMLHEQGPASKPVAARESNGGHGADSAIKEVGENRWVVSKSMVESVRENFATQLRLAQMQPRLVDGKTNGFLVQRIYPRSILAKMGIEKGDVVIDVNNIKLDSPEKAMQIFQQLREAQRLSVGVERNGQPLSFVYEIE